MSPSKKIISPNSGVKETSIRFFFLYDGVLYSCSTPEFLVVSHPGSPLLCRKSQFAFGIEGGTDKFPAWAIRRIHKMVHHSGCLVHDSDRTTVCSFARGEWRFTGGFRRNTHTQSPTIPEGVSESTSQELSLDSARFTILFVRQF